MLSCFNTVAILLTGLASRQLYPGFGHVICLTHFPCCPQARHGLKPFAIINVAHGQEAREGSDEASMSVYNVTEAELAIWFLCQMEVS